MNIEELSQAIIKINERKTELENNYANAIDEYGENSGIARVMKKNIEDQAKLIKQTKEENKEVIDQAISEREELNDTIEKHNERIKKLDDEIEYLSNVIRRDEEIVQKGDLIQQNRKEVMFSKMEEVEKLSNEIDACKEKINSITELLVTLGIEEEIEDVKEEIENDVTSEVEENSNNEEKTSETEQEVTSDSKSEVAKSEEVNNAPKTESSIYGHYDLKKDFIIPDFTRAGNKSDIVEMSNTRIAIGKVKRFFEGLLKTKFVKSVKSFFKKVGNGIKEIMKEEKDEDILSIPELEDDENTTENNVRDTYSVENSDNHIEQNAIENSTAQNEKEEEKENER